MFFCNRALPVSSTTTNKPAGGDKERPNSRCRRCRTAVSTRSIALRAATPCRRFATKSEICIELSHAVLCGPLFIEYTVRVFRQGHIKMVSWLVASMARAAAFMGERSVGGSQTKEF